MSRVRIVTDSQSIISTHVGSQGPGMAAVPAR
jgi:hypothetical protein